MSELEHALSEVVRQAVREELAQQPQQQEEEQPYFTVQGAVEYSGTTGNTVRNALKKGHLKRETRGNRSIVITRQALDDWLRGRT